MVEALHVCKVPFVFPASSIIMAKTDVPSVAVDDSGSGSNGDIGVAVQACLEA